MPVSTFLRLISLPTLFLCFLASGYFVVVAVKPGWDMVFLELIFLGLSVGFGCVLGVIKRGLWGLLCPNHKYPTLIKCPNLVGKQSELSLADAA